MMLELPQETVVMQGCTTWVVWQVIFPVLLMRAQYLQLAVLQKLKPDSFGAEPCLFVFGKAGSAITG